MRIGQRRGFCNQIMRPRFLIGAGRADENKLPRPSAKKLEIPLDVFGGISDPIHHHVIRGAIKGFLSSSNVVNINGRPGQLAPSDDRYIDYYGRPWAKNWDKYFEKGWDKPDTELPPGILDIFNNR